MGTRRISGGRFDFVDNDPNPYGKGLTVEESEKIDRIYAGIRNKTTQEQRVQKIEEAIKKDQPKKTLWQKIKALFGK